jgi:hypothetical protein
MGGVRLGVINVGVPPTLTEFVCVRFVVCIVYLLFTLRSHTKYIRITYEQCLRKKNQLNWCK